MHGILTLLSSWFIAQLMPSTMSLDHELRDFFINLTFLCKTTFTWLSTSLLVLFKAITCVRCKVVFLQAVSNAILYS